MDRSAVADVTEVKESYGLETLDRRPAQMTLFLDGKAKVHDKGGLHDSVVGATRVWRSSKYSNNKGI